MGSPVEMQIKNVEEWKGWVKRELCLMADGNLKYFENDKMKGFIRYLDLCLIVKSKKKGKDFQYAFEVHTKEYLYYFAVETERLREKCIKEMNCLLKR